MVLLVGLMILHIRAWRMKGGHNRGERGGATIVRQDAIVVALISFIASINTNINHVLVVVLSINAFLLHCIHCMNRSN